MRRWIADFVARIVGGSGKLPQAGAPGAAAEQLAEHFLAARAARVLDRNVRCRGGEVDLIIDDHGTIAFVEVRLRRNPAHGGAAASITPAKQRRLTLAARHWCAGAGRRFVRRPQRFDAVLLDALDESRVVWLKGAFEPS